MSDESDDRYWEDRTRRRPDDDWRDDRPRRRQYGDDRDDYDEQYGYSDPRQKVRGPGLALMIVGIVGVLLSFGFIALAIFMLIEFANNPARPNADDELTAFILIACGGVSAAACLVVAMGGSRMRQCRNWGLAMTAAILAVASIALFGLCSVFILPFGIWALVVLNNSEVKREFRRVALRGNSEEQDYVD